MPWLRDQAIVLGPAELRGYVRARALAAVRREVEREVAERRVATDRETSLVAAALEHTVHLVAAEFHSPPVVAIPSPHVRAQRAA